MTLQTVKSYRIGGTKNRCFNEIRIFSYLIPFILSKPIGGIYAIGA